MKLAKISGCLCALLLFQFFGTAIAQEKKVDIVYVNGIQNTLEDATETMHKIKGILDASVNHSDNRKPFFVVAIWNPVGWNGSLKGPDLKQDTMEVFLLKTAEENFATDFQKIMVPFNQPRIIDQEAAKEVVKYLDDMTPGNNSIEGENSTENNESDDAITDENMRATQKAIGEIVEWIQVRRQAVVIAHSQGNLLANLAYAKLASVNGNNVSDMIRVVNVANTSEFSVNNLNFTHEDDGALFSAGGGPKDTSLETLPSRKGWTRTTPKCTDSDCDFIIASAPFGQPTTGIPDQGIVDNLLNHGMVTTYLSTVNVPLLSNPGITFTASNERFVDRFEDFVYAAADSLLNQMPTPGDKAWSTPTLVWNNPESVGDLQVAMDGNGNAIAVWNGYVEGEFPRLSIWSSRYMVGNGWNTATVIETNTEYAAGPQVAVDSNGSAMVVWEQRDDAGFGTIWANRYAVGTGWGTATMIQTSTGVAFTPHVAVDSSGNAIAVWWQDSFMWANQYAVGAGWGTAIQISFNTGTGGPPQVAIDGNGNAMVVWSDFGGYWAKRYGVDSGWGIATLISTTTGPGSLQIEMAMDNSGNVIVVWSQFDGSHHNIWANRFIAGGSWGVATIIETNAVDAFGPQVDVDSNGNATVVWESGRSIWANRYVLGSGWGTATVIETNTGEAFNPHVGVVDNTGNAIAVWLQFDGLNYSIYANRYDVDSGWGTAELIENSSEGTSFPQVAVNSIGNAIAVWPQGTDTSASIWANRFE